MKTIEEINKIIKKDIDKNGPLEKNGDFNFDYIDYGEIYVNGLFSLNDLKRIIEISKKIVGKN